jgi:hypothetical protein
VLSAEDAAELIKQAEADAEAAKAQAAANAAANAALLPPPPSGDTVRVTYVPEIVKAQMREEIKDEVMAQAREENWAAPRTLPPWITKLRLFGDFRFRSQNDLFPSDNLNGFGSNFWNYNGINSSSSPYDYTSAVNPPYPDTNADRWRLRMRLRFGGEADLGDGFTAGVRIATGETNSPVSQNQTLGGSGGNFSKYAIWLDRGFVKYQLGENANRSASFTLGRFENPFFATRMIWADDLGFDGVLAQSRYAINDSITPFLTLGALPVYNTDFNFATTNPVKFQSHDKWLEAIQIGLDAKLTKEWSTKWGVAYYHFDHIEGEVSDPFLPLTSSDAGDTDTTRPGFAQKGNTYIALRNIIPDASNDFGKKNQWQYFGLATPFHELALTGRVDYAGFDPVHLWLMGEGVKNVAFDRNAILRNGPPLLRGPVNNIGNKGIYDGGDTAWIITLNIGQVALEKAGDWNASIGYRRVESDAVVDGFCDTDFGGGGTNLKGFTLSGAVALSPRTWLGLRWSSADNITGPTFKQDTLQIDFNAKF